MKSLLKTESDTIAAHLFFLGVSAVHLNFFKCSKHTTDHVTKINQSALQDLLLIERSAKLKMEEQLIILAKGYPKLYDTNILIPTKGKTPGDICSEFGITSEHDDMLFLLYVTLRYRSLIQAVLVA